MMDVSDMTRRGQLQRLHDVCGETNKVFRGCHVVIHDTLSLYALDASAKPFREFGLNQTNLVLQGGSKKIFPVT